MLPQVGTPHEQVQPALRMVVRSRLARPLVFRLVLEALYGDGV